jgi:DNA-binding transcriptional LysR family regulator
MDELASIRTFIDVVNTGSFSAAARKTNSSVSAVARQIKALEDDLGVRLLNRSTRNQALTEPGQIFYQRVSAIMHDLSSTKLEVGSFENHVKGMLRVSLRTSSGTTIIVPALSRFLDQHPGVTVEVSVTDERVDLIANKIDVAVWIGELENSELVAKRLTSSERIVCGSPDYFTRYGIPKTPEDLVNHNCVVFKAHSYGNRWGFAKDGVHKDVAVSGNITSSNGLVTLAAASSGLGLVVVQEWVARLPLAQGQLQRVFCDYKISLTDMEAPLYAVYPSSRGLSRKVRAFVDFLTDLYASSS